MNTMYMLYLTYVPLQFHVSWISTILIEIHTLLNYWYMSFLYSLYRHIKLKSLSQSNVVYEIAYIATQNCNNHQYQSHKRTVLILSL